MRSRIRLSLLAVLALIGATLFAAAGPAGAEPVTEQFDFTGDAQEFVVPDGVTEIEATTCGAQGGASENSTNGTDGPVTAGGLGGCATSTLAVTPGETLDVLVGGAGNDGFADSGITADLSFTAISAGNGGFNGGEDGTGAGALNATSNTSTPPCNLVASATAAASGGGGGASDLRRGTERLLVGGGGGSGGSAGGSAPPVVIPIECQPVPGTDAAFAETGSDLEYTFESGATATGATPSGDGATFAAGGVGGSGGGDPATAGADGADQVLLNGGTGGGPGSDVAGGTGGATSGSTATDENGGRGAAAASSGPTGAGSNAGGSGGGGFFGGGGGGSGDVSNAPPGSAGAGGGGGGGAFGPAGSVFEAGTQSGDGVVFITYEVAEPPVEPEPTPAAVVRIQPQFTG